jgi:hypothetical protein
LGQKKVGCEQREAGREREDHWDDAESPELVSGAVGLVKALENAFSDGRGE